MRAVPESSEAVRYRMEGHAAKITNMDQTGPKPDFLPRIGPTGFLTERHQHWTLWTELDRNGIL